MRVVSAHPRLGLALKHLNAVVREQVDNPKRKPKENEVLAEKQLLMARVAMDSALRLMACKVIVPRATKAARAGNKSSGRRTKSDRGSPRPSRAGSKGKKDAGTRRS